MSIVVRYAPRSFTTEQYDEAVRRHEEVGIDVPPDGLDYDVCFGSEGNLRVSGIWDSREQVEAYGERLMPILANLGIDPGEPDVFEVHTLSKEARRLRAAPQREIVAILWRKGGDRAAIP